MNPNDYLLIYNQSAFFSTTQKLKRSFTVTDMEEKYIKGEIKDRRKL